jgi:hypothetical protein
VVDFRLTPWTEKCEVLTRKGENSEKKEKKLQHFFDLMTKGFFCWSFFTTSGLSGGCCKGKKKGEKEECLQEEENQKSEGANVAIGIHKITRGSLLLRDCFLGGPGSLSNKLPHFFLLRICC